MLAAWAALLQGVAVCLLVPTAVSAQSLFAADGLGALSEPLDARSRGLGGSGIGMTGAYLLEGDPAASAAIFVPTASLSFQTATTTLPGGGTAGHTRFPAIGASYPFRGSVFSVRAGSFLDQEWEATSDQTIGVGGEQVDVSDRLASTGSVARVSLGWARTLLESAAVGVVVGTHTGTTERLFTRQLNPEDVGVGVLPYESGSRFRASGLFVGAGVRWDPLPLVRVAGSLLWSDELVLSPTDGEASETGRYKVPLELRGGGTVSLTSGLGLHLGVTYSDWSETGLVNGSSRGPTWSYGGGLEWDGATFVGKPMPLRAGVKHKDLPFLSVGETASERTYSGGLALDLVAGEDVPFARLEVGVERGNREAASLREKFWRTVVSVWVSAG